MTTALITGATAGLGAEFARQLARQGHDLVLVARDIVRLEASAEELRGLGVEVEVLSADLTDAEQLAKVASRLADPAQPVGVLINNAGIGLLHDFAENPLEVEVRHLHLHVEASLTLCHAALQGMLTRGSGRIVNVASVAAFVPRGTYSAAKAWLLAFSRWANRVYGPSGVAVTALCPGFTHTEFHQRMGMERGRIPAWAWLDAARVVRDGLRDNAQGKGVSVPSKRYKGIVMASKFLPDRLLAGPARVPEER